MKISETPFSPGDEVIAYLRDSGHENQETSIGQQEAAILEYCNQHRLILARCYKDEARKGSSDIGREALDEMMNALRHLPALAGVIVWSNSRFARNTTHAQFYRAEIRKLGYTFHSLTDHISDGPESVIFEALIDYKNQQFLTDLSIDVKRGLRQLVELHGCVPGTPPTGFLREEVIIGRHRDGKLRSAHRWIINQDLAPRIRQAFEMRANGASLAQINTATQLFSSINSFRTFFCNRIYLGELHFGDDLIIPHYCDPIVDGALFEAVQTTQNNYTRHKNLSSDSITHPRRVNSAYLLSGLVFCARCGSPLFGRSHPQKNGTKTISYYCTRAYNKRDCTKQRIPGEKLHAAVLKALRDKYQAPEYLTAVGNALRAKTATQLAEHAQTRKKETKDLAETRRQITNISNAIAAAGHSAALLKSLKLYEDQEADLLNRIAKLDAAALTEIPPYNPGTGSRLVDIIDHLIPLADIQSQRRILASMIKSIHTDREGRKIFGVIEIYYPPPNDLAPGTAQAARGENKTVRMSRAPSGPPRYTHSFDFEIKLNGLSGHYKSSH